MYVVASALPMFVLIQSYMYVWQIKESVFPIAFGCKLEVGLSRHILLLSCLNQRKHSNIANTCFAREPYSLSINSTVSLKTFQSGWFHESAWIHYQQNHNQLKKTTSFCSTRQRLRCQHKKKRSCLIKQTVVPSVNVSNLGNFQLKEIFKRNT